MRSGGDRMGGLMAVHPLGLTVTDVDRSARWYSDALDFVRTGRYEAPGGERRKIFLNHPGLGVRLGLVQHQGSSRHAQAAQARYAAWLDTAAPS
jgi:glyoxylase I family protein